MTLGTMAGLSTNIPNYINEINDVIVSFGSNNYKVNTADLNIFKMY